MFFAKIPQISIILFNKSVKIYFEEVHSFEKNKKYNNNNAYWDNDNSFNGRM